MVSRSNSSINEPLVPYRDRNSNTYSEAGSDTPLVPLGGMDSRRGSTTSGDLWALMSNGRQPSSAGTIPFSSGNVSEYAVNYPATGKDGWEPEDDDWLHNPSADDGVKHDYFSLRGIYNFLTLGLLAGGLIMLFGGYPILSYVQSLEVTVAAFNLGSVNGSAATPASIGNFGLIDDDTPEDAYSVTTQTGETWELIFSDEFDTPGRTFWPGDDPYWEALDLHAWATTDLEYYSPFAVQTVVDPDDDTNGLLRFTLSNITQHDLYYQGAEISSWNKFCFTGGRLEVSVRLPGRPDVYGLWPAVWTLGNLGRVGYGGTLEGLWPYSYDACDAGTLPNQTYTNGTPTAVATGNTWSEPLSYLTGQRLSACTCPDDETHPGPKKSDGTWTGRSAPEIDLIEAQVDHTLLIGQVSQSCQYAPFNLKYIWDNETNAVFYDESVTALNSYSGGQYQMSASSLTTTNQECYQYASSTNTTGCLSVYAFEYETGYDGYVTWFTDDKAAWTFKGAGFSAQADIDVSARPVPEEPLYIIMNLAISTAFTTIDYEGLAPYFPMEMDVDYVRVYQDPDKKNIGCDPEAFPTAEYIALYPEGYADYNITTWDQMTDSAAKPKNRLEDTC